MALQVEQHLLNLRWSLADALLHRVCRRHHPCTSSAEGCHLCSCCLVRWAWYSTGGQQLTLPDGGKLPAGLSNNEVACFPAGNKTIQCRDEWSHSNTCKVANRIFCQEGRWVGGGGREGGRGRGGCLYVSESSIKNRFATFTHFRSSGSSASAMAFAAVLNTALATPASLESGLKLLSLFASDILLP